MGVSISTQTHWISSAFARISSPVLLLYKAPFLTRKPTFRHRILSPAIVFPRLPLGFGYLLFHGTSFVPFSELDFKNNLHTGAQYHWRYILLVGDPDFFELQITFATLLVRLQVCGG